MKDPVEQPRSIRVKGSEGTRKRLEQLCEEGDVADSVWILHDVEIAAISWSETRPNITLRAPALIGEIALLQEQNSDHLLRQYSYRWVEFFFSFQASLSSIATRSILQS